MNTLHYKKPIVIAIAGGSAAGKGYISKQLSDKLTSMGKKTIHISQDNFYRNKTPEEMELIKQDNFNFDVPDLIDDKAFCKVLVDLINGKDVTLPIYSFITTNIIGQKKITNDNYDVIIVEGLFILYYKYMFEYFDIKVFVDTKDEIRCKRRITRDMSSRKPMSDEKFMDGYMKFVVSGYNKYIYPTKSNADIIISGDGKYNTVIQHNNVFYDLICNYVL